MLLVKCSRRLLFTLLCGLSASAGAATSCHIPTTLEASAAPGTWLCALGHRQVLMIGDIHGTDQIPEFTAHIISAAAKTRPVILGLERMNDEQADINAYINGGPDAKLRNDGEWRLGKDGRSSQAVFALLTEVRALKAQGLDVRVAPLIQFPHDQDAFEKAGGRQGYANQSMADSMRDLLRKAPKNALLIAYMGNMHAAPGTTPPVASVSERIANLHPWLLMPYGKGSSWNCTSAGCGAHEGNLKGDSASSSTPDIAVTDVHFDAFTASPPEGSLLTASH